jgi:RHS repeat-associated protein
VVARYDYDPYGKRRLAWHSGALDPQTYLPIEFDFGFTGHLYHGRSGLYFAPLRAYDPELGRWLSRDPIDMAGGINLYEYVGGDPVNAVDYLGLSKKRYTPLSDRPTHVRGYWVRVPMDDEGLGPNGGYFFPDEKGDGWADPDGDGIPDRLDRYPDNGKLPERGGNYEPYTQDDWINDKAWERFGPNLSRSLVNMSSLFLGGYGAALANSIDKLCRAKGIASLLAGLGGFASDMHIPDFWNDFYPKAPPPSTP